MEIPVLKNNLNPEEHVGYLIVDELWTEIL
jgi:hypothetical protein